MLKTDRLDIDETKRFLAGGRRAAITSVEALDPDVDAVYVRPSTRGLDRLAALRNLRAVWAAGLRETELDRVCAATGLTHLAVFGSRLASLMVLRRLSNLRALMIMDARAKSLGGLEWLRALEYLALAECTGSLDLDPLRQLVQLRYLWLSGTTWTPMRLKSLEPLSALRRLERLQLSSVRVADRRLAPLMGLDRLVQIELPDRFPREEFLALGRARPDAKGFWLEAHTRSGAGRPRMAVRKRDRSYSDR